MKRITAVNTAKNSEGLEERVYNFTALSRSEKDGMGIALRLLRNYATHLGVEKVSRFTKTTKLDLVKEILKAEPKVLDLETLKNVSFSRRASVSSTIFDDDSSEEISETELERKHRRRHSLEERRHRRKHSRRHSRRKSRSSDSSSSSSSSSSSNSSSEERKHHRRHSSKGRKDKSPEDRPKSKSPEEPKDKSPDPKSSDLLETPEVSESSVPAVALVVACLLYASGFTWAIFRQRGSSSYC